MGKRRILVVDLDDVLIDFNGPACAWHNETYGTNYSKDDIRSYDLGSVWKCSEEEKLRRVFEFYASEAHLRAPPVRGAIETLAKIRTEYDCDLFGATSRPEAIRPVTYEVLDGYGVRGWFLGFEFLGHYHGPQHNRNLTKADVCRRVGACAIIDDMKSHTSLAAAAGISALLYDAPWNQGEVPEGVVRVKSWEEVPPLIPR